MLLGDGELQEGQVWEALQTISHRGLQRLDLLVDRNGYQSERPVAQLKRIPDLARAFEGLGFRVHEVDGHDPLALVEALEPQPRQPRIVIADTIKAGGSRYLRANRGVQPWHGRVPDEPLYRRILAEQVELAGDPAVVESHRRFVQRAAPAARPVSPVAGGEATREGYAQELRLLLDERPELVVLDADLAASCGLARIAEPRGAWVSRGQFLQMGISEQDMVSFAGGLALEGLLPVVSSYAAFLKRALEQVHANLSMGARVIYSGHYAGLCYFSDGRSHQCLDDPLHYQGFPGMDLVEPVTPLQAAALLRWAVERAPGSVYLRLRRGPAEIPLDRDESGIFEPDDLLAPLVRGHGFRRCFVCAGTVATRLALDCLERPQFAGWGLVVVQAFREPADPEPWGELLRDVQEIAVLEECWPPGVLRPWLDELLQRLRLAPRRLALQPRGWGASFRSLRACQEHFGFTVQAVEELVRGG